MFVSGDCQFALHEHLAALIRSLMSSRGLETLRGQRVFENNMSLAGSATKWHALFTEWLIRTIGPSRIGGNPVQYRKTATHRISASALEPPAPVPQPTAIAAHRRRKHGKEQRRASGRAPGPCWGLDDGPKEKTDGLLPALVMPKAELLRARTNAPVLGFHAHRYLRLPTWVPSWHRHKSEPTSPRGASTRSSSSTSQVASLSGLESVPAPGSAHSRRPAGPRRTDVVVLCNGRAATTIRHLLPYG